MNLRVPLSLAALVASAVLASGCYYSTPPAQPHRLLDLDPLKLPELAELPILAVKSPRVIVLGHFETTAPQPIGGLYDFDEPAMAPLYRTFFFHDAHLEVFEHTSDTLRAAGLDVRKDYETNGAPNLVEERVRKLHPILVSATIRELQHDQVRAEGEPYRDFEVARLRIAVLVRDTAGAKLYEKELRIEGRIPAGRAVDADPATEGNDLLRRLGHALGGALLADAEFLRAVGASS